MTQLLPPEDLHYQGITRKKGDFGTLGGIIRIALLHNVQVMQSIKMKTTPDDISCRSLPDHSIFSKKTYCEKYSQSDGKRCQQIIA